jgi:SPP1 family predicted phage head-tail adaptor
MRGRQIEEKAKAIFRIRYRSGYTQSMRILFDGDYYGILRIDKIDGLRRYLEVTTTT